MGGFASDSQFAIRLKCGWCPVADDCRGLPQAV